MTWVDYGIIAVVGISLIIGLFRGFVREVVSLVVWVAAVLLTLHYLPAIEAALSPSVSSEYVRYSILIIGVLVVTLFVSWLLGKVLTKVVSSVGLGFTNRFVGLLFGLIRGILIVAFLVILLPQTDLKASPAFADSKLLPSVQPLAGWLGKMIPTDWAQRIKQDVSKKLAEEGL
jgi:membrane protein required for colicin V production